MFTWQKSEGFEVYILHSEVFTLDCRLSSLSRWYEGENKGKWHFFLENESGWFDASLSAEEVMLHLNIKICNLLRDAVIHFEESQYKIPIV